MEVGEGWNCNTEGALGSEEPFKDNNRTHFQYIFGTAQPWQISNQIAVHRRDSHCAYKRLGKPQFNRTEFQFD